MLEDKEKDMQELDLDMLAQVSGGAGSKGAVEVEGTVTTALQNSMFQVNVGGQTITACLSGQMRMNLVRVKPGDTVRVEYTPGSQKGRITWRARNQ